MHVEIYMSAYILDAVYAQHVFPGLEWAWSPVWTILNMYFKLFSKCSFRGVIIWLSDHFVIVVYILIFEQDPHFMSKEAMKALLCIVDWYASPFSMFLQVFSEDNSLHVLRKFTLEVVVMQEVV